MLFSFSFSRKDIGECMFFNVIGKLWFMNESNAIVIENYPFKHIDYLDLVKEYPTLDMMYNDFIDKTIKQNNICLIKDDDYNIAILDYCKYLHLDYNMYKIIRHHSDFYCYNYLGFGKRIKEEHINIIEEKFFNDYPIRKKINRNFHLFPAEYAINCLDESWAANKYKYLRLYALFVDIQKIKYQQYLKGVEYKELNMFNYDDQTAKISDAVYNDIVSFLISKKLLPSKNIYNSDIKVFANTTLDGGYDFYHSFKFNFHLAKYIKQIGYKISA